MSEAATVYEQHARHLIDEFGVAEARRMSIASRNQSAVGSFTYGFHNAVLKQVDRIQRTYLADCDSTPPRG